MMETVVALLLCCRPEDVADGDVERATFTVSEHTPQQSSIITPPERTRPSDSRTRPRVERRGTPLTASNRTLKDDNEVERLVLSAARETAQALALKDNEWRRMRDVFANVTRWNSSNAANMRAQLLGLLEANKRLANARSTQLGTVQDGFTPLHAATVSGNIEAVDILVNAGNADVWARDLQGRTALHLAIKYGKHDLCGLLKGYMEKQGSTPIGKHAPVDLIGNTPLASLSGSTWNNEQTQLVRSMLADGDRSILPAVAWNLRSGWAQTLCFAYTGAQNFCQYMEDRLTCISPLDPRELKIPSMEVSLFAVFDGHGGSETAQYASNNISRFFTSALCRRQGVAEIPQAIGTALEQAFVEMDAELGRQPLMKINRIEKTVRDEGLKVTYEAADTSGSTANVAVVTESHVIVASVGDSRAVLVYRDANNQDLRVKPLSVDHKPGLDEERNRIEKAGGRVTEYKVKPRRVRLSSNDDIHADDLEEENDATHKLVYRVDCEGVKGFSLAMSRSLGDFMLKLRADLEPNEQIVSPVPEVHIHTRTSSDVALVIATDGVWDEIDNDEAGIIFDSALAAGTQVEEDELEPVDETEEMMVTCARIADEYVRTALMKGSFDNMAVLVVRLDTAHTVSRQLFV